MNREEDKIIDLYISWCEEVRIDPVSNASLKEYIDMLYDETSMSEEAIDVVGEICTEFVTSELRRTRPRTKSRGRRDSIRSRSTSRKAGAYNKGSSRQHDREEDRRPSRREIPAKRTTKPKYKLTRADTTTPSYESKLEEAVVSFPEAITYAMCVYAWGKSDDDIRNSILGAFSGEVALLPKDNEFIKSIETSVQEMVPDYILTNVISQWSHYKEKISSVSRVGATVMENIEKAINDGYGNIIYITNLIPPKGVVDELVLNIDALSSIPEDSSLHKSIDEYKETMGLKPKLVTLGGVVIKIVYNDDKTISLDRTKSINLAILQ